jgi:two-component system, sensor histidine kinase PdtaS
LIRTPKRALLRRHHPTKIKMNRILTILFIFIFSGLVTIASNQSHLDSLKHLIETKKLSDQVLLTYQLQLAYYCQPLEGLKYAQMAREHAHKIGNPKYEAWALEYISIKNRNLGNNLAAINASIEAANIYKKLGIKAKVAEINAQLGAHFGTDKDFVNALKYLRQALDLFKNQKDTTNIIDSYINIGETYRMMNNVDSAEHYMNTAFAQIDMKRTPFTWALALGNLGLIHAQKHDFDKALVELNEAIKVLDQTNHEAAALVYKSAIGSIYLQLGQTTKGEMLLNDCYNVSVSNGIKESIRDISKQLSLYYEGQNRFEKALEFRKVFETYNDSLRNIENVRAMEQQQSRFELAIKEDEIATLNRINNLQITINYGLGFVVLLFLLFLFFLFRSNRIIKKANELVVIQKMMVEKREEEKALLLRELNHRVKNNLQMVSSLLNLQARQLKGHPEADALIAGRYRVDALTLIHQKLYREDVDTTINIRSYIEELAYNLVHNFGQRTELSMSLIEQEINIEKAIPLGLIVNELLTNSLKYGTQNHSDDKPTLHISLEKKGLDLILKIADNGPGMPPDFDWKKASSFGLKLVHSLINQLQGEITYKKSTLSTWKLKFNLEKIG